VHRKTLKDEQLVLWLFPSTRPRQRIERLAITLIKTLIEKKQENSPCMATKGKKTTQTASSLKPGPADAEFPPASFATPGAEKMIERGWSVLPKDWVNL